MDLALARGLCERALAEGLDRDLLLERLLDLEALLRERERERTTGESGASTVKSSSSSLGSRFITRRPEARSCGAELGSNLRGRTTGVSGCRAA